MAASKATRGRVRTPKLRETESVLPIDLARSALGVRCVIASLSLQNDRDSFWRYQVRNVSHTRFY